MVVVVETTLDFYLNKYVQLFTKSGCCFEGTIQEIGTQFFTFLDDRKQTSLIAIDSIERIKIEKGGK